MATFNVRVSGDMAARFDAWAITQGGRSAALRQLICQAAPKVEAQKVVPGRLQTRPVKMAVRLSVEDARGLQAAVAHTGLTPSGWAAALIRRRLNDRPTFGLANDVALVTIQVELRRLGVNVNQIARVLNEADPLDLNLAYFDDLRAEVRTHMVALRDAIAGNLAYWQVER